MKDSEKKSLFIILGLVVLAVVVAIFVIKGCGVKEYTITYDSQGGTAVSTMTIKENGTISEPATPVKDGYTFVGWYYNGEKFDFSTKVTKDMTLEARWEAKGETTTGMEVDADSFTLALGSDRTIKVTLTGDIKDAKLKWESSDESIATVDSKGKIKALKEGDVKITVSTADGKYSKVVIVSVKNESDVAVTKVTISGSKTVEIGKTIKLTANITPKNATNKAVTWKSSNTKIATVDKNGNVKGIAAGTAKITVTTKDGNKKATITITVKAESTTKPTIPSSPATTEEDKEVKVTSITINGSKTMDWNTTQTLTATVKPDNATNKAVTWTTSNANIATVDTNGNVKAVGEGDVTITATAKDGSGVKGTITIHVNAVYEITFTAYHAGNKDGIDSVLVYNYEITKNNKTFNDFAGFMIGTAKFSSKSAHQARTSELAGRPNTTTLELSNGHTVTANVKYVENN